MIWNDILDTRFPDAENKHDSKNVDLFTFQTPNGACNQRFISFLMYIIKEQFMSLSNNVYSFILETIIYK